jgi:maltose alpha-D-glucosyltransferase/alpha-amylase
VTVDRAAVAAAVRALDLDALSARRWFAHKGEAIASARLAHAFALAPSLVLALVDLRVGEGEGRVERYAVPFVEGGGAVGPFDGALEDGAAAARGGAGALREAQEGDGAWRALAVAMADGRTIPALGRDPGDGAAAMGAGVDAALVCRRSPGFAAVWPAGAKALADADEVALGRDQSNTSVVLGGDLLLKAYRRVQPGLNPDLELTAFLSEEAEFPGVPRLAGWAEVVTRDGGAATLAMLQAFVAHAGDAYEATAEGLAALIGGPGAASLESATDLAEDLGVLVAGLHAALAAPPREAADMTPRAATHDELKTWRHEAHRRLNQAIHDVAAVDPELAEELRDAGAQIAARASRFEAVVAPPLVMRIHADLHLGQVLLADDGYRVIDFEGEPLRPIDERRRLDSPLRDVASMLRSLDHVARSARRRAGRRNGGPIERPGLDVDAWIERARERFLAAYAAGLRQEGAPIALDLDLLDAFEVAKECYEFSYAASVLPSWLWAPRDGMRWLLAHGEG